MGRRQRLRDRRTEYLEKISQQTDERYTRNWLEAIVETIAQFIPF